jgi:hypothetical protein
MHKCISDVFVQFLGCIWSLIVFRRFFDRAFECLDYLLRQWSHFVNVFINSALIISSVFISPCSSIIHGLLSSVLKNYQRSNSAQKLNKNIGRS